MSAYDAYLEKHAGAWGALAGAGNMMDMAGIVGLAPQVAGFAAKGVAGAAGWASKRFSGPASGRLAKVSESVGAFSKGAYGKAKAIDNGYKNFLNAGPDLSFGGYDRAPKLPMLDNRPGRKFTAQRAAVWAGTVEGLHSTANAFAGRPPEPPQPPVPPRSPELPRTPGF